MELCHVLTVSTFEWHTKVAKVAKDTTAVSEWVGGDETEIGKSYTIKLNPSTHHFLISLSSLSYCYVGGILCLIVSFDLLLHSRDSFNSLKLCKCVLSCIKLCMKF